MSGCGERPDPKYGWWRLQCAAAHTEMQFQPMPTVAAPGGIPIGGGLSYVMSPVEVCDRYEPYCPKGKTCDPAQRPGP